MFDYSSIYVISRVVGRNIGILLEKKEDGGAASTFQYSSVPLSKHYLILIDSDWVRKMSGPTRDGTVELVSREPNLSPELITRMISNDVRLTLNLLD